MGMITCYYDNGLSGQVKLSKGIQEEAECPVPAMYRIIHSIMAIPVRTPVTLIIQPDMTALGIGRQIKRLSVLFRIFFSQKGDKRSHKLLIRQMEL